MSNAFALELAFTETCQRYLHHDPALREAHCLWVLLPPLFDPPQPGDLFPHRRKRNPGRHHHAQIAGKSRPVCPRWKPPEKQSDKPAERAGKLGCPKKRLG
ncbi:MAG: hypothetical protein Fur0016_02260 [Anaerolineales bacterium]